MPALEDRRRTPVLVAAAVVAALVVAGGAWALTRGGGGSSADPFDRPTGVTVPSAVLGRGSIPGGFTWILEARRDGSVCATFTVSPGPPPRERCERTTSGGPVHYTTTGELRTPEGSRYLTLGWVSERTARVRAAEPGSAPRELETMGGGTGLDVRFFVHDTPNNVTVTYTALAADGTALGPGFDRTAMPAR